MWPSGGSCALTPSPSLFCSPILELTTPEWASPSQPPSPSFLRVLHAGRILQDGVTLSCEQVAFANAGMVADGAACNLPTSLTPGRPTVIHLSVRSFSIHAEEGESRDRCPYSSRRLYACAAAGTFGQVPRWRVAASRSVATTLTGG
jgi:hypothetical protein